MGKDVLGWPGGDRDDLGTMGTTQGWNVILKVVPCAWDDWDDVGMTSEMSSPWSLMRLCSPHVITGSSTMRFHQKYLHLKSKAIYNIYNSSAKNRSFKHRIENTDTENAEQRHSTYPASFLKIPETFIANVKFPVSPQPSRQWNDVTSPFWESSQKYSHVTFLPKQPVTRARSLSVMKQRVKLQWDNIMTHVQVCRSMRPHYRFYIEGYQFIKLYLTGAGQKYFVTPGVLFGSSTPFCHFHDYVHTDSANANKG